MDGGALAARRTRRRRLRDPLIARMVPRPAECVGAAIVLALVACSCGGAGGSSTGNDAGAQEPDSAAPEDAGANDPAPHVPTHVYVFGGVRETALNSLTPSTNAFRAPLQADGSLGAWERFRSLDGRRYFAASAIAPDGRVMLAGGREAQDAMGLSLDRVEIASIDPATPFASAGTLPERGDSIAAAVRGARVYVSGGRDDSLTVRDEIWSSSTFSDWTLAGRLAQPRAAHRTVVLESRLYVIGGVPAVHTPPEAAVTMAPIRGDGTVGTWAASGVLPVAVSQAGVAVSDRRVFVIGGESETALATSAVSVGSPSASGALEWAEGAPLPKATRAPCAVAVAGTIYVLGGFVEQEGRDPAATVLVGRVTADGKVAWTASAAMPEPRGGGECVAW